MNYYQRLRDIREDLDKSQAEIAEILGIQQTQYSRYERGFQKMGIDKYIVLAKYYNISLDYLCGLVDKPYKLNK
ncbi:MAG: helix-turn-helix transcriptional regulator [Ruminococcaceae bacterium]|nr:helix-turn-helix transcriptional regulator [Oscillospiraceae bacterium]